VLFRDINNPDDPLNQRLLSLHFGPEVSRAIQEAYVTDRKEGIYYLLRPRPKGE
jgi:hypothetical protein